VLRSHGWEDRGSSPGFRPGLPRHLVDPWSRGVGPAGVAGQPLAPVPNPGSIVKVQAAPQFKGKTYSAYITWEVQFEFWAKRQRLWALYLGTVSPPAAAGYTPALPGRARRSSEQDAANQEWAFGELVQALALDEHVQLILEFKGDNSNPPSPHEAWMRIRALFMRDLPTSKIQLTRILGQLLLEEGESIMDFWRRASNIRTRHEAVHGRMDLEEWLGRILSALLTSWENIKSIQVPTDPHPH